MGSVREAGGNSSEHTASPAGVQAREDDGQVVQVLKNIVPVQHRERCDQMEEADQQDGCNRHRDMRPNRALLLHERFSDTL